MTASSITAIIPCYNAEPFLAEAIQSVLSQTRPADEVIVVDDGSTDRSVEVAERFPVKLVRLPENRGHAAARNAALRAAQGEYIAWLDADDYWRPNHLETVCPLLERFPEAAVAYSAVQLVGQRNEVSNNFPCLDEPRRVLWDCFRGTILPAMTAVVRRRAVEEIGGYDESLRVGPDYDLWLRLSLRYPFICTKQVTACYRWHPGQISQDRARQIRTRYESRLRFLRSLQEEGPAELAAEAEQRARGIWNDELRGAWRRGDSRRLRLLLSLQEFVPGSEAVAQHWRRRSLVPGLLVWSTRRAAGGLRRFWRAVTAR